jgi:hypothetical protein
LDRRAWRTCAWLAVVGAVALLVNGPWLAFGWLIGTGPLPESGTAVRYHAIAEIPYTPDYYSVFGRRLLGPLLTTPYSTLIGLVVLLAGLLVGRRQQPLERLRAGLERARPLRFALFYCVALFLAYSLFIPAHWFFARYLHPLALFILLATVLLVPDPAARPRRQRRALQSGLYALVVAELALGGSLLVVRPQQDGYLDIGLWAHQHLAGQTIGSYQAGALSYWADDRTTVVNLDGIVDRYAFRARREGRLQDEIRRRGVRWVLDWKPQPGYPYDGDFSMLAPQQEIPNIRSLGAPWYLFKVE